jgi:hypothetical protein
VGTAVQSHFSIKVKAMNPYTDTITIQAHDRIVCEIFNLEDLWFTRIEELLLSKEYDKALELVQFKLKPKQN